MNGGRESHSACIPDFAIVSALSIRNLRRLLICHTVSPLCCGIGGLHIKNLVLGWLRTVIISTQLYESISYLQKKMRKNTKEIFTLVHKLVKNSVIIFTKHFAVS